MWAAPKLQVCHDCIKLRVCACYAVHSIISAAGTTASLPLQDDHLKALWASGFIKFTLVSWEWQTMSVARMMAIMVRRTNLYSSLGKT